MASTSFFFPHGNGPVSTDTEVVSLQKINALLLSISNGTSGGSTPGGTSGQLQYNNNGALAGGPFWDSTNLRLGIGTTTPAYSLDVTESSINTDGINVNIASGATGHHALTLTSGAGTLFDFLASGTLNIGGIGINSTAPLSVITTNANTAIIKDGFGGAFGGTNYALQVWTDNQNNPHIALGVTAGVNTSSGGLVGINVASGTTPAAQLEIDSSQAGTVGLNVVGAASQSADILQVTANGGSAGALFKVTAAGVATGNGSGLTTLNATNLSSGTVAAARMPALTGAITTTAGAVATSQNYQSVVQAGTGYTLTTSYGTVVAGTTSPTLTCSVTGTYLIVANVQYTAVGATFASINQANAGILVNGSLPVAQEYSVVSFPTMTTYSAVVGSAPASTVQSVTAGQVVTVQAIISNLPSAGSCRVSDCHLYMIQLA